jgi:hypothetical protein
LFPTTIFRFLEAILEKHIPPEELQEVKRILYGYNQGKLVQSIPIPQTVLDLATQQQFEVKAFGIVSTAT